MTDAVPIRRVGIVLFEGFTCLDVYGPLQAFASCRVMRSDGTPHRYFEITTLAQRTGAVRAGEGVSTLAEHELEAAPDCDVLLVPGGFGTRAAVDNEPFLARLTAASRRAPITAAVCTGSALLARTGLLDDRPATSNKIAWEWVVRQGPRVRWQRRARWVDDGDIVTSSGVSAGIDMTLAVIARLNGRDLALASARNMEYVWREDPADDPFA